MKDKTVVLWANKVLRSLPAQWQERLRIPQFKATEALDEVVKGYNMAEAHIRHMENQTREELAKMMEGSVQQTLDVAEESVNLMKVRLAACDQAATGEAKGEQLAVEGDKGWSETYDLIVALYRERESKNSRLKELSTLVSDYQRLENEASKFDPQGNEHLDASSTNHDALMAWDCETL